MNIEKLLYESFERSLTEKEEKELADALASSIRLRKEKQKILRLRASLSDNAVRDFSTGFEEKVFRKMDYPEIKKNFGYTFFNSLITLFGRIAYATVIIIIISLSYNFTKSGRISLESALGIKQQETSLSEIFYNNLYYFFNGNLNEHSN